MRKKVEERPRKKLFEVRYLCGSKQARVQVKGVRTATIYPAVGEGAVATPDVVLWRIEDEDGNALFEITMDLLISCLVVKHYRKAAQLKVVSNGTSGPG